MVKGLRAVRLDRTVNAEALRLARERGISKDEYLAMLLANHVAREWGHAGPPAYVTTRLQLDAQTWEAANQLAIWSGMSTSALMAGLVAQATEQGQEQ